MRRRGFLAALGAAAAVGATAARAEPVVTRIDAEAARSAALSGEIVLIDVRTPQEWRASGAPDAAVLADMTDPGFGAQLMAALGGDKTRPVAFICASGRRSSYVADQLAAAGFTQVYDVSEGVMGSAAGAGWAARGLPLTPPTAERGCQVC